jgi:acyl dehydratase
MPTIVERPQELPQLVGAELGVTGWVAVEQEAVSTFGRVTRDEQWIHVDPARAADGPFGTTIAHGYFTLSLCSAFVNELLIVRGAGMIVNYGLDRVRFPGPVAVGSRLRARGELLAAEDRGDVVQTTVRLTFEDDGGGDKPVCVADQLSRFYPPSAQL